MVRCCIILVTLWLGCSSAIDPAERAERYTALKSFVTSRQHEFGTLYKRPGMKDSAVREARQFLFDVIHDSMPLYWNKTVWNFYGTTEVPGQGSIACGYFVTTVLRDAGFKLNRVALAETYSEKMIKSLVEARYIKRYPHFNLKKFVAEVSTQGNAVYIVGLDFHTGFIICKDKEVFFLHSNYTSCVMKEKALESAVLERNNYAVTGCLTQDNRLLANWLKNEAAGAGL